MWRQLVVAAELEVEANVHDRGHDHLRATHATSMATAVGLWNAVYAPSSCTRPPADWRFSDHVIRSE
jgi:hypothetical protein